MCLRKSKKARAAEAELKAKKKRSVTKPPRNKNKLTSRRANAPGSTLVPAGPK